MACRASTTREVRLPRRYTLPSPVQAGVRLFTLVMLLPVAASAADLRRLSGSLGVDEVFATSVEEYRGVIAQGSRFCDLDRIKSMLVACICTHPASRDLLCIIVYI
jgi:hypothetical protein